MTVTNTVAIQLFARVIPPPLGFKNVGCIPKYYVLCDTKFSKAVNITNWYYF